MLKHHDLQSFNNEKNDFIVKSKSSKVSFPEKYLYAYLNS